MFVPTKPYVIMNKLKTLLFMALICAMNQDAFSQFYALGPQLSRISGGPLIKNFGIHGTAEYMIDEKMGVIGSIGYFLPHKTNSDLTLYARNSQASPSYITINSVDKTSGFQLSILGKRYFGNEYEGEGVGFYGLAGLGLSSFSVRSKLDDYDESTYGDYERSEYESESGTGFTLTFGLGLDLQTDGGTIYFEPQLNIPANRSGDTVIEVEIPATIQFNLGYRILIY